eukprot:COSAG01_NODE_29590_length_634_cov_0.848598_1_plen_35_part_10
MYTYIHGNGAHRMMAGARTAAIKGVTLSAKYDDST